MDCRTDPSNGIKEMFVDIVQPNPVAKPPRHALRRIISRMTSWPIGCEKRTLGFDVVVQFYVNERLTPVEDTSASCW
jgi:hypothetical protein